MQVDKDKPGTWIKYKSQLCNTCIATCCTMPVEVKSEDLVRLQLCDQDEIEASAKKVANRLIKQGIVSQYREKTGLYTITQKSNSDCYFLGKDRLCTVYEIRPNTCRQFPEKIGRRVTHCPYIQK